MFAEGFDNNAMNVHLVRTAQSSGVANKPGRRLYINRTGTSSNSNTLAHEFGHNFGLHHTHNGSFPCSGDNGDCANCWQEPVSRTMLQTIACGNFNNAKKCEVNGDGLCDTPADPNLDPFTGLINQSTCNWQVGPPSNFTDNWGVNWVPEIRNVMSYSLRSCRTNFSYSQAAAMFWELQNPIFSFKSTSAQHTISGPTLLCPNQTYTFTAPTQTGSQYYLWQVPDNWTLTGQGNQTVSITVPGWVPGEHDIFVNSFPGNSIAPLKVTFNTSQMTVFGPNEVADDGYCRVFYTTFIPGMTYTWSTSAPQGSGVTICSGQGTNTVTVSANQGSPSFFLNVSTSGLCGIPSNGSKYITVSGGGGGGPITRVISGEIQFYPNPAEELLFFRSDDHADFEIEQINILNIATRVSVFNQGCGRASDPLDISRLKGGVYLITYYHNNQLKTKKLIKQ
jgi:hypothetical protein